MNLPNKITLFRVVLVPIFVLIMLLDKDLIPYQNIIGCVIFCIACISDFFDGYLARKWQLITNFGKFMDPLADKMLVTAALLCLTAEGTASSWISIIILSREFIVSGVRIAAAAEGNVIAASWWGKIKTVWQMISIIIALVFGGSVFVSVCLWIAALLTVISGIDYLVKNAKYLSMK